jgi:hypothetical protein
MKLLLPALLIALAFGGGCATNHKSEKESASGPTPGGGSAGKPAAGSQLLVTPVNAVTGKVATYNSTGRFVVLDFPLGHLPALEQTLFVYRQGLKVGEVKITGPERDNNTIADLVSGEAQRGDEVRDR